MGLGAAGAATIAGQMGPQVLSPEEIITAPAGAYVAGVATGNALANADIRNRICIMKN